MTTFAQMHPYEVLRNERTQAFCSTLVLAVLTARRGKFVRGGLWSIRYGGVEHDSNEYRLETPDKGPARIIE